MKKRLILIFLLTATINTCVTAQNNAKLKSLVSIKKNSHALSIHEDSITITGVETHNNITIPAIELDTFIITSTTIQKTIPKTAQERVAFRKLKRNIGKVYPYAQKAIKLLNEIEAVTVDIEKKRHRKKYLRRLEKQLKGEFEGELKKLSVSQGKVLIKLIERDTGKPFYQHIKTLKNPVSAFTWQTLGKTFGYNLKEGYDPKKNQDMEYILAYIEEYGLSYLNVRFRRPEMLRKNIEIPQADELLNKKRKELKKHKQ